MAQFAARANVSGPTILRLIAKLGFNSYPDFQQALRDELELRLQTPLAKAPPESGHPPQGDFLATYTRAIIENIEASIADLPRAEFEAAVTLLADPRRRILLLGGRFTSSLAIHLYLHLRELRPRVQLVEGQTATWAEHLLDLGCNDVLVVSTSGASRRAVVPRARSGSGGPMSSLTDTSLRCGGGGRSRLSVHHGCLRQVESFAALNCPIGSVSAFSRLQQTLEGQQAAHEAKLGTALRGTFSSDEEVPLRISELIGAVVHLRDRRLRTGQGLLPVLPTSRPG